MLSLDYRAATATPPQELSQCNAALDIVKAEAEKRLAEEISALQALVVSALQGVAGKDSKKRLSQWAYDITILEEGHIFEPVCSDEFMPVLDSLDDVDKATEALETIRDHLRCVVKQQAKNIAADGMGDSLRQSVKNLLSLEPRLPADTVEVDSATLNMLVDKLIAVDAAFQKYDGAKTKPNMIAFNKCMVAFRQFRLPVGQQTPFQVDLLRQCLAGLWQALQSHSALQQSRIKEAEDELKLHLGEAEKISYGCRDGSSWKAAIPDDWTISQLLDFAHTPKTGLVNGPGARVSNLKESLEQAFAAAIAWPVMFTLFFTLTILWCSLCRFFFSIRSSLSTSRRSLSLGLPTSPSAAVH